MLRIGPYAGGVLIVVTMTPIILATASQLLLIVLFDGTIDGSIVAFILLIALLPGGIGVWLFAYHPLYHQIRGAVLKQPEDVQKAYFGRWLSQRRSRLSGKAAAPHQDLAAAWRKSVGASPYE